MGVSNGVRSRKISLRKECLSQDLKVVMEQPNGKMSQAEGVDKAQDLRQNKGPSGWSIVNKWEKRGERHQSCTGEATVIGPCGLWGQEDQQERVANVGRMSPTNKRKKIIKKIKASNSGLGRATVGVTPRTSHRIRGELVRFCLSPAQGHAPERLSTPTFPFSVS